MPVEMKIADTSVRPLVDFALIAEFTRRLGIDWTLRHEAVPRA
jgi:hypothetical protein